MHTSVNPRLTIYKSWVSKLHGFDNMMLYNNIKQYQTTISYKKNSRQEATTAIKLLDHDYECYFCSISDYMTNTDPVLSQMSHIMR